VLDDLLAIGQEEKFVCKQMQSCILMRHDDFDNGQILQAVTRFCKVQQEGLVESLFERPSQQDVGGGANVTGKAEEIEGREIPSLLNEEISNFRAQRFAVDDDNDPDPENIPSPQDQSMKGMYLPWESEPLDPRRTSGERDVKPTMVRADLSLYTVLGYFLLFSPLT
jgi:hypothetical protein